MPLKALVAVFTIGLFANAMSAEFKKGPVFSEFGPHADVRHALTLSESSEFRVAFDVAKQGNPGAINKKFESLARFINMHVANGVPKENIQLALVVHGKAIWDLTKDDVFHTKHDRHNANLPLLKQLMDNGVRITVCGQSAAYYQISPDMLAKGVNMSLSAMTEHALLQQQGYTLNPF
jgi:intracellular sulfur oxidation DsrE/DsrF family protein